jgi:hypothetical protein
LQYLNITVMPTLKKKTTAWQKWKKKAPKVPDITCPIIDDVLIRIDKFQDSNTVISKYQWNLLHKRMERLRTDNELLREGGQYWYEICKQHLKNSKK